MALPFTRSADFAIDKPAGVPCPNLTPDTRCSIHLELRTAGFRGCVAFDCFGAGQQVTRVTFAGRDWRTHPELAGRMFDAFAVMRQLHEMLFYLRQAAAVSADPQLAEAIRTIAGLTELDAHAVRDTDVAAHRAGVSELLAGVSATVRGTGAPDRRGADLIGRDLRAADLRRTDLRGALLIGADLRRADLGRADLLAADLRGADLGGANLATSLFVTAPQLDSARGDRHTSLPPDATRPAHWR